MGYKAYKVFNPDWTCRNFRYEIGEKYITYDAPELCRRGFHACQKLSNCFSYYDFDPHNKVAEVDVWGFVKGLGGDKIAGSCITILRELSWYEVLELSNIGHSNTGHSNTGDRNTGSRNTGGSNTGDRNTGDSNTGDRNTGHSNTGHSNTGSRNTGGSNTGHRNTGYSNTGSRNSGHSNTGDWNSGVRNSGFFNSKSSPLSFFNKRTGITISDMDIRFPNCLYFAQKECENYKDAARRSIGNAPSREHEMIRSLPNYDPDVFEEIFGIRI